MSKLLLYKRVLNLAWRVGVGTCQQTNAWQGPEVRVNVYSSSPSCGSDVATATWTCLLSGLAMGIGNVWTTWETLSCWMCRTQQINFKVDNRDWIHGYAQRTSRGTYFKGEMLRDFRVWSSGSLLRRRLLSPSSLLLLLSFSLLSSFDLSLDFDVSVSVLSSFSNSCRCKLKHP